MATKQSRMHGRVEGAQARCAVPGCGAPGEFKAPLQPANFDGPGAWRFLCLDHVREHNAKYNFFEGMSPDEIRTRRARSRGWERPSRKFAHERRRRAARVERLRRSAGSDLGPLRPDPGGAETVAVRQGRAAGAVRAGARRGRRSPPAAPALFRPGPPLPPRQERRRSQPRRPAPRSDRGLSAASEVAGLRLIAVGRAEREIDAGTGRASSTTRATDGRASTRAR